jgi:hypothetical protein
VIYLSVYSGNAISSVSLGGDDIDVSVVDITIEMGEEPIYIIADSHEALIWRFSGAIERVTHVILNANFRDGEKRVRAGVVGLSRSVLHPMQQGNCFAEMELTKLHGAHADRFRNGLIGALTGRDANLVLYSIDSLWTTRQATRFLQPSGIKLLWSEDYVGRRTLPQSGDAIEIWRQIARSQPGGIVDLDPATVVSPVDVKRYTVLPSAAGIAQLIDEGALVPIEWREGLRKGDRWQMGGLTLEEVGSAGYFRLPEGFRIVKPIHFPGGSHMVYNSTYRLYLAPGVPKPEGKPNPNIDCLTDEVTNEVLFGKFCRQ